MVQAALGQKKLLMKDDDCTSAHLTSFEFDRILNLCGNTGDGSKLSAKQNENFNLSRLHS